MREGLGMQPKERGSRKNAKRKRKKDKVDVIPAFGILEQNGLPWFGHSAWLESAGLPQKENSSDEEELYLRNASGPFLQTGSVLYTTGFRETHRTQCFRIGAPQYDCFLLCFNLGPHIASLGIDLFSHNLLNVVVVLV